MYKRVCARRSLFARPSRYLVRLISRVSCYFASLLLDSGSLLLPILNLHFWTPSWFWPLPVSASCTPSVFLTLINNSEGNLLCQRQHLGPNLFLVFLAHKLCIWYVNNSNVVHFIPILSGLSYIYVLLWLGPTLSFLITLKAHFSKKKKTIA